jgi:hypothetical protein
VFVTVSERVCLTPTVTLPKLRLAGLEASGPAVEPVPDRGIVKVGFDPLDVSVTVPLTVPAAVGMNETLKVVLWPPVRVTGEVIPLMLNPEPPAMAAWEIVTLDPPVLVTVADRVCLTPTATLPKLRLAGFEASGPAVAPFPDKGIVKDEFDAFDAIVIFPLTVPAAVGSNETLKGALWPAVSVSGAVIPLMLNPDPPAIAT